jgi:hypothetical protein
VWRHWWGKLKQEKGKVSGTAVEANTHRVGWATAGRGKESVRWLFSTARVLSRTSMAPGVALQLREGNATVGHA